MVGVTNVHDSAVDISEFFEAEEACTVGAVVEDIALYFPMSSQIRQLGGQRGSTVVA